MGHSGLFHRPADDTVIPTLVWGSGNMGRAAIRSVASNPHLELVGVLVRPGDKVGTDAGRLAGLDTDLGVLATADEEAALLALESGGAVAYMCSGELRPDEAVADMARALAAGAVVVSPSVYPLYDPTSAPDEIVGPIRQACEDGKSAFFASGVDPGWGNDVLALLATGLTGHVEQLRCQEIFDYSTYDAEDSVRYIVGFGQPMDYDPMMVAPGIPSMVWGGQVRLLARALGVEVTELREEVERVPLEADAHTGMGLFEAGTQGGLRFEVQGIVDGVPRIVVEHVTRISPEVAPSWPQGPGGESAHRVLVEGSPRLEITVEATAEGGNRAAGGNETAANRLVNAITWLRQADPGLYDGLDVPLTAGLGRRP